MKKLALVFLVVASLAAVCFADAGPGPVKPDIIVKFTTNHSEDTGSEYSGSGFPYTGDVRAIFHCNEPPLDGTSPVGERDVELACSKGVCKNDNWFYKFNPCFYPKSGSIKYVLGGGDAFSTTPSVSFPEGNIYEVTVDTEDGKATIDQHIKLCPLSILGFGILGLGMLRARKSRS